MQQSPAWVTWHSPQDHELRSQVIKHVHDIFAMRKPELLGKSSGDPNKLPDFIRRLEEALYKSAPTREEYANVGTLEARLQEVVRRVMHRPNMAAKAAAAKSGASVQGGGGSAVSTATASNVGPGTIPALQQPAAIIQHPQSGAGQPEGTLSLPLPGAAPPAMAAPSNPDLNGYPNPADAGYPRGYPGAVPGAGMAERPMVPLPSPPPYLGNWPGIRPPQSDTGTAPQFVPQFGPVMSNGAPVLLRGGGGGTSASTTTATVMPYMPGSGYSIGGASLPPPNGFLQQPAMGYGSTAPPSQYGQAPSATPPLYGGAYPTAVPAPPMYSASQQEQPARQVPQTSSSVYTTGPPPQRMGSTPSLVTPSFQQQHQYLMHPGVPPAPGTFMPLNNTGAATGAPSALPMPIQARVGTPDAVGSQGRPPSAGLPIGNVSGGPGATTTGVKRAFGGDDDATLRSMDVPDPSTNLDSLLKMADGSSIGIVGSNRSGPNMNTTTTGAGADAAVQNNNAAASSPGSTPKTDTKDAPDRADVRRQQILKQQRWLLFLRHCAKCQLPENECQYGASCSVAKALWHHLIHCKDVRCAYPRCLPSRELLKHHQKCSSPDCPVCAPVKQYVSRQRALDFSRRTARMTDAQKAAFIRELKAQQQQQRAGGGGAAGSSGTNGSNTRSLALAGRSASGMLPPTAAEMSGPIIHTQTPKRPRIYHQENYGTSLLEFFDERLIKVHLSKLQQAGAGQTVGKGRVFTLDDMPNFEDENSCKVCGLNRLTFEPPSLYCFTCGQRIKRNQVYYHTPGKVEIKGFWCHPCFAEMKTDVIQLDGWSVRRAELEKRKNDEEVEEGWVQCDLCERWVHQVCGLFNKGRNEEQRDYHCPQCLLSGLQRGERTVPRERPQAMLAAGDLPRCELSDFIEARLRHTLAAERAQRAAALGVDPSSVPTATDLTVRVVNNVRKKNEVRQCFLDAFRHEGCPEAFMYRQKVILLFQTIDGVDICVYCLYVQEYGDDAPEPNRKTIYLSYLDSVKYFQPEDVVAAGRGIALRTLVYHEILLGYLAHAKRRGFLQMFIWACPPLQGDDYILYCHPGKQKTPRSDRLREWYLLMLRQARAEGIVSYVSNLYDTYFEGGRDHRLERPSILHVPYFEGDYWPGEAENLLANLGEEVRQAGKKGGSASRSKASKGKRALAGGPDLDVGLLGRLGETIAGMREDFIVVHLAESCSSCRGYISGDVRYVHPSPPQRVTIKSERTFDGIALDRPGGEASRTQTLNRFQLCPNCYALAAGEMADASIVDPEAPRCMPGLPAGIELSALRAVQCPSIPSARDSDLDTENEFFDTRQAFLSLCQGNHYQFDSLRRAKHSSMMVLYHLHNPSAPGFACTCNVCQREIPAGEGWRCPVCPDFDMCADCYRQPSVSHPHALEPHARKFDETRNRLTEEERRQRAKQLQRTMQMLIHASACNNPACPSTNCAKIKQLFQHAMHCPKKIHGNCQLCWRMWSLLQVHAKQCTVDNCPVPRCRELRQLSRNQAARREDQRRRAYRAMLTNQAVPASA